MSILLITHIVLGMIGLLSGLCIVVLKKGTTTHKKIGKIFTYAMSFAMLTSFPISIIKGNVFLFCIGIWTLYMIVTGTRALTFHQRKGPSKLDWAISIAMLLFGVILLFKGFIDMIYGYQLSLVSLVFSGISLAFVWADYHFYKGNHKAANAFQLIHIQRMMGAFIASFTAFVVVNNTFLPGLVAWLLPTLVFTPLIIFWSRKWTIIRKV